MKRSTKLWLIAGAALVLIGLMVFGGALALNHGELPGKSGSELKTEEVVITEDFRGISIDVDTEDITIAPSRDGRCMVVFQEPEEVKNSASVQNGVLNIGTAETGKWYERIGFFSFGKRSIKVYLPKTEYEALTIKEDTGDIDIAEEFTFNSIDISVSTGDVDCLASANGRISIHATTGDIRAASLNAAELDLGVSTGHVSVESVSCEGAVSVKVSTGKAALKDVTCGSLVSNGSTGDVDLRNVVVSGSMTIDRSTGDIKFDGCDAAELLITTDTGDVTGTLLTEKVFIVKSDTGRVNVPESVTGGKCKIETDTGDIKIQIAGN